MELNIFHKKEVIKVGTYIDMPNVYISLCQSYCQYSPCPVLLVKGYYKPYIVSLFHLHMSQNSCQNCHNHSIHHCGLNVHINTHMYVEFGWYFRYSPTSATLSLGKVRVDGYNVAILHNITAIILQCIFI